MHTRLASLAGLAVIATACAPVRSNPTVRSTPAPVYVAERECGDVRLPESLEANGHALVLNGMAIKRVTFLNLEVFVSGLYLEHEMRDVDQVLASRENRRLVLRFVRHVSHGQLERGLRWALTHNATDEAQAYASEFDSLLAALPSFSAGDELTFDQSASGGLRVLVNGVVRTRFASADFARLCLLVFLGPHGNLGMRLGLVGGHCNR